jgi:AraC-like DNA-binding protein
MAVRQPAPALRAYVRQYAGWFEHMAAPLCRRELPTDEIPVIISFGAPIRVYDAGDSKVYRDLGSFSTGAYDSYVRVLSAGPCGGIQINFTILGARLFLGRPLGELTNQSVPLDCVLGPAAPRLESELYDAPTWDDRFDILDREIGARFRAARRPSAEVLWTWRRLVETGGQVSIDRIVDEIGRSHRHVIACFREHIGLTPKTMARVLRFSRAARALREATPPRLVDLANDCGYYDQAHFTRDFRAFAGVTPRELLASLLPDGGGIAADW